MEQLSVEEQKKRVSKRLEEAFERERAKHGRSYSQKRFAYDIGLRGDSGLSVWMNGYELPSVKALPLLAAHPAIGGGIYDDMNLPRPMPQDKTIRDAVRLMEDQPKYKPIIRHLLDHPEDLEEFKELMERLEKREKANGHLPENGAVSA